MVFKDYLYGAWKKEIRKLFGDEAVEAGKIHIKKDKGLIPNKNYYLR